MLLKFVFNVVCPAGIIQSWEQNMKEAIGPVLFDRTVTKGVSGFGFDIWNSLAGTPWEPLCRGILAPAISE